MNSRRSTLLAAAILAGTFGCGTADSTIRPVGGSPVQTNHVVSVSATCNSGSSTSPAVVTYVSQTGKDTITWQTSDNSIPNVQGLSTSTGPYTVNCTSNPCSSGGYTGSFNPDTPVNYSVTVGSNKIYGRIIIKP